MRSPHYVGQYAYLVVNGRDATSTRVPAEGKAWKADITDEIKAQAPAALDAWLINCPGRHPFWQWWTVSLVSLADIPGIGAAVKRETSMTHEIIVVALNPETFKPTDEWYDNRSRDRVGRHFMHPIDLSAQFEVGSDQDARDIAFLFVRALCDGYLTPDQDGRIVNAHHIEATAKHYREGAHTGQHVPGRSQR